MNKCRWCDKEGEWPFICANTRDMEDKAIEGNDYCLEQLAAREIGEKGLRYVVLNFIRRKRELEKITHAR